ncbi:hypothetical protein BH09PSE5_BH09PSE5_31920 [soil metagenome]
MRDCGFAISPINPSTFTRATSPGMSVSSALPGAAADRDSPHDAGAAPDSPADAQTAVLESHDELIACEECDLVYRKMDIDCAEVARCERCGSVVQRGHRLGLQGQLALTVTALVVFMLANLFPIVTIDLRGVHSDATVSDALLATWDLDQKLVAVIAGVTAVFAPLMVILLRLYVTVPLALGRVPVGFGLAMQALRYSSRWSMVEVFMLGTLVSIVRVAGLASIVPGVGIFSFGVLTFLLASIEASGTHGLWGCAGSLRDKARDELGDGDRMAMDQPV